MKARPYEFIEHTADIGIKIKAGGLKGLFRQSALVMFEIIAEKNPLIPASRQRKIKKFMIKQQADNIEELFVNWLNELLSLSAVKGLIFFDFKINKLSENLLQAAASGESAKNYKVNAEIKAATYHELKIEKSKTGWQAQIIFDV